MWARSYTLRAILAIAFLVGFYAVALGTAAGLLFLAYGMVVNGKQVLLKLVLMCVIGAGVILWSLIPRRVQFEPPGPLITAKDHPRLFALIEDIAQRMQMEMPAEVYLMGQLNAFVMQRGGVLGFGGRRVMAIGVPMLAVENVSQLSATLAHEFGHFAGGETRLGGLIYATRRAMITTLQNLHQTGAGILSKPFEWMLNTYMRITQAISRQQELLADSWSVRIAGKEAHLSGLNIEHLHGLGFNTFMQQEVQPLFAHQLAPENLFEGYRGYVQSAAFTRLKPLIEAHGQNQKPDPYDSHPALPERLAFGESLEGGEQAMDLTPAWSLLERPEQVEAQFSGSLRPPGARVLGWQDLGEAWALIWRERAVRVQARLPDFKLSDWVDVAAERDPEGPRTQAFLETVYPSHRGYKLPDRAMKGMSLLRPALSTWLSTLLSDHGYRWTCAPGEPLRLLRGESNVDPDRLVAEILEGQAPAALVLDLNAEGWGPELQLKIMATERARASSPLPGWSLEDKDKHTVVTGPMGAFFLPMCCPVCAGPGELSVNVTLLPKSFLADPEDLIRVTAHPCKAHEKQVFKAMDYIAKDERAGTLTLHVHHRPYADMIRACVR